MKRSITGFLLLFITVVLVSCEDVVPLDPAQGKPVVIVEGWISSKEAVNNVKLYLARRFNSTEAYTPITGATLVLSDNRGNKLVLPERSAGNYEIAGVRPAAGTIYTLSVSSSYGEYEAVTEVRRRSLKIDSLGFEYNTEGISYNNDGYYPLFSGSEREGEGDRVLFKLYRNGRFLNRARDINLLEDRLIDGRHLLGAELDIDSGLVKGDKLKVEVWSLDENAYYFWTDLRAQLASGGLFSPPMTNTRSNVIRKSDTSAAVNGFFGSSLVDTHEITVGTGMAPHK